MMIHLNLSQPQSFENGNVYLYRERGPDGHRRAPSVVKFVNYDPCPAFMIVYTLDGFRQRCLREDLFSICENDQQRKSINFSSLFRRHIAKV